MSQDQSIWRCDRSIPSDTAAGRCVLGEVLVQLEARNWSRREVFAVHLAMEEALVNAIIHGNKLDAERKIRVVCDLTTESIRIEIADEGDGFDPSAVPDPREPDRLDTPSGRGVMLMREFMTRVEFCDLGSRIVLEKDRMPAGRSGRRGAT